MGPPHALRAPDGPLAIERRRAGVARRAVRGPKRRCVDTLVASLAACDAYKRIQSARGLQMRIDARQRASTGAGCGASNVAVRETTARMRRLPCVARRSMPQRPVGPPAGLSRFGRVEPLEFTFRSADNAASRTARGHIHLGQADRFSLRRRRGARARCVRAFDTGARCAVHAGFPAASAVRVRAASPATIKLSTGFERTIAEGATWRRVGATPQGDAYRPLGAAFAIEGSQVHEAYLVVREGALVEFSRPGESRFSPLTPSRPVTIENTHD
ncbi:hypothetical protein [Burkholderia oklahomensis]|uniref:hypothetical protein n=1 Tax=Burkholderia oklahomensis TaxID=342113 RepID=UPI0005DA0D3E|nr:hypothetical protein [Burkholderia oklahomensis]AJX31194.1 hypothetical protein BG90_1481 [Burkholderia oklahomensis C6786]MBI0359719.1 hypothetical protein [Burkholderia oklahomensis]SUW59051.1 Uncharacterised protein [Burkholderia oklahomensis]